jgi:asparaginyl-tRNA synthetase
MSEKFISIQEAIKKGSGKISIRGWIHRERGSNKLKFIVLRDSTNLIQCVLPKEKFEKQWKDIDKLLIESSVEIIGQIKKEPRAPTNYEVHAEKINIIQTAEPFPIAKDQSPEFLLDNRHLWLRSRKMVAVMKIRHTILDAFREHYKNKGFFEFSPPILQPTQCEGGSTLFPVK